MASAIARAILAVTGIEPPTTRHTGPGSPGRGEFLLGGEASGRISEERSAQNVVTGVPAWHMGHRSAGWFSGALYSASAKFGTPALAVASIRSYSSAVARTCPPAAFTIVAHRASVCPVLHTSSTISTFLPATCWR